MTSAIDEFWQWWIATGGKVAARAIATGAYQGLEDELSQRLARIHPELQWELAAGSDAAHALCITAAGIPELRSIAERICRAAPPATSMWQYHPARVANRDFANAHLTLGSQQLACADARFQLVANDRFQCFDVGVFHPLFPGLDEADQLTATSLLLDWALGEDEVVRWVDEVTTLVRQPGDGRPVDGLIAVVRSLADRHPHPEWALLHHQPTGGPIVMITARRPMHWIDYPLYDQHLAITIRYQPNEVGLPTPAALDQLRAAEDDLVQALADAAVLVAHDTSAGRRTLHFYADGESHRAAAVVQRWADEGPRHATIQTELDPGWQAVQAFR